MIRPPNITGTTEKEKLSQVIEYLMILAKELQRMQEKEEEK